MGGGDASRTIDLSAIPSLKAKEILLPLGWRMTLCEHESGEGWQGFVESPCRQDTASLAFARQCGTTSGEDIPLPEKVRAYIMRPEFNDFE